MAEKLVLIPQSAWHHTEEIERRKTIYPTLMRLENEIGKLLESELHTDFEKVKLLNQLQQKYKGVQANNEPIKISIDEKNSNAVPMESIDVSEIIKRLPKASQNRGAKILGLIKINKHKINWDDQLRLVIDGNALDNTNIIDLVKMAVGRSKKLVKPHGSAIFEEYLKDIGSPLTPVRKLSGFSPLAKKYKFREQKFTHKVAPNVTLLAKKPSTNPAKKLKLTEWKEE